MKKKRGRSFSQSAMKEGKEEKAQDVSLGGGAQTLSQVSDIGRDISRLTAIAWRSHSSDFPTQGAYGKNPSLRCEDDVDNGYLVYRFRFCNEFNI